MILSVFFFVKQKTAYEMRISDWSSDVCSSDLTTGPALRRELRTGLPSAVDAPAAGRARRSVLFRPRRYGGEYPQAPLRHPSAIRALWRHLPVVACARGGRGAGAHTRPDRRDARWRALCQHGDGAGEGIRAE